VARDELQPPGLRDGRGGHRLSADQDRIGLADQRRITLLGDLVDIGRRDTRRAVENLLAGGVQPAGNKHMWHQ